LIFNQYFILLTKIPINFFCCSTESWSSRSFFESCWRNISTPRSISWRYFWNISESDSPYKLLARSYSSITRSKSPFAILVSMFAGKKKRNLNLQKKSFNSDKREDYEKNSNLFITFSAFLVASARSLRPNTSTNIFEIIKNTF